MKNPILEELHQVREQLLEETGGTLAGLIEQLQLEQGTSGREVLTIKKKESKDHEKQRA